MVKVSYVSVPVGSSGQFKRLFTPVYKTKHSSLRFSGGIIRRRKVVNLTTRSLLPQIRDLWHDLGQAEVEQWNLAGRAGGYSGYQSFVQEMAYRIKHAIPGQPVPTTKHAYKVGRVELREPHKSFSVVQQHPIRFYRMKKVRGTKSQREPVAVEERLILPLTIEASLRSKLTVSGNSPIIRYYAAVTSSYQGRDLVSFHGFNIPLVSDWTRYQKTITTTLGTVRYYRLFCELTDVVGLVEFDNLTARHSGSNFARDFRSTNISSGYSDYNYQIPASWVAVAAVDGGHFSSVYPDVNL